MPLREPWNNEVVKFDNRGLDLIHPVDQVDAQHYSRFINVKSVQEGSLQPRPGSSLVNSVAFEAAGFAPGFDSETDQGCGVAAVPVVSGAGVGLVGSYVTLIASTARQSKFIHVAFVLPSGLPDLGVFVGLDLAFDAGAGPEVNFLEEHAMFFGRRTGSAFDTGDVVEFPFEIPAGSRIRARVQDNNVGAVTYRISASIVG